MDKHKYSNGVFEGINRNILECKLFFPPDPPLLGLCINRNILECKYSRQRPLIPAEKVLIETYWNVNVQDCLK